MSRFPNSLVWLGLSVALFLAALHQFHLYVAIVLALLLVTVASLLVAAHLRSSRRGLALLLVTAVVFPLEVARRGETATGGGVAVSACFLLAAFLCGAWLLRLAVLGRRVALDSSRLVVAALVFIGIAVLSFITGLFPWFRVPGAPMRAQFGGLGLFVLSGGIFLVTGHEIRSLVQLRRLTWLFFGAGAISMVMLLAPGSTVAVGQLRLVADGSVGALFFTWLVAMSVSQGVFNRSLRFSSRVLCLALAGTALARGLLLTFDWASGWLPPLVALGVILLFRFPRVTVSGALLGAAPVLLLSGQAWDSIMENESWSWMTRVEALKVMGQVIERNPWLGLGPANYHYYTPLYSLIGYNVRFNSHNNYVDLLAQTGIVGLLAFLWFATEAGRLALQLRLRLNGGFESAYAVGVLAGVAGSLVAGLLADWLVPFVYNVGIAGFRSSVLFWFFIGGLLALRRLTEVTRPAAAVVPLRRAALALDRA